MWFHVHPYQLILYSQYGYWMSLICFTTGLLVPGSSPLILLLLESSILVCRLYFYCMYSSSSITFSLHQIPFTQPRRTPPAPTTLSWRWRWRQWQKDMLTLRLPRTIPILWGRHWNGEISHYCVVFVFAVSVYILVRFHTCVLTCAGKLCLILDIEQNSGCYWCTVINCLVSAGMRIIQKQGHIYFVS